MKTFIVIFAVCIIGVHSQFIANGQREELRLIRNVCVYESGLNPYEIGAIIRAVRPAEKLLNASRCIIQRVISLRQQNESLGISNLPIPITDIAKTCENLVGAETCEKIFYLVGQAIQNIRDSRNPLLRQAEK